MIGGRCPAANERTASTGGLTQSALLSARVEPPVIFWPAAPYDVTPFSGAEHRMIPRALNLVPLAPPTG
jgi:hypothetical protein